MREITTKELLATIHSDSDTIQLIVDAVMKELCWRGSDNIELIMTIAGDTVKEDALILNSNEKIRQRVLTLAAIYVLLRDGKVVSGMMNDNWSEFIPWVLSPEQVVEKVKSKLEELDASPNIHDEVVWFKLVG